MRRPLPIALIVIASLASSEAHTSDKGITSELVHASVAIFCATSIADDLAPIVDERLHLAIAKMSQDALAERLRKQAERWRALRAKHKVAIDEMPLSARLTAVDERAIESASEIAWQQIAKTCPARAKRHTERGAHLVFELLTRRIAEFVKPPPSTTPPSTTPPPTDAGP